MSNIKDIILLGADAIDNQHEWEHERSKFMNASEAATCIRRQWFSRHGDESLKDKETWGFARRGHSVERWAVECMRAANHPLVASGADQQTLIDEERKIAGTPDGYIKFDDGLYVVDIKSIDPRAKLDKLPKKEHVTQVQINIALYNHLYGGAVGGKLVYVNCSDFDTILEYDVEAPADDFLDSLAPRVSKILRTKKVEVLDREGKLKDFGKECNYCPWRQACGVELDDAQTATTGRKGGKLHAMVLAMSQLKETQNEYKAQYDALRADIIKAMENENITYKEFPTEGLKVSLTPTAGRSTFDRKLAENDVGDLSPYYKVGKSSVTLKVETLV